MKKFFLVDRRNFLSEGMLLELKVHEDITPQYLQDHANTIFPKGVSNHGDQYFLGDKSSCSDSHRELIFEYVRQSHFPDLPSRFQSFFAVETLQEAQLFNQQYAENKGVIWQVEAKESFRADMILLNAQLINLQLSYFAHSYWSGMSGQELTNKPPFWEYLLVPPVRVLAKI